MLDFGFSEIVLTSAIALIVLGPEKLPKVARQVGNWMGRARAMARQLTEQLEREVDAEELLKSKPKSGSAVPMTPIAAPEVQAPAAPAALAPAAPAGIASGSYSADPAHSPNGADWQPSPPETQASNE